MRLISTPLKILAVLSFVLCQVGRSHGATDGTLGSTSTGTAVVSVINPGQVKISFANDISLGTWSGSGQLTANDNLCAFTNYASGNYNITASGSGASGAFHLVNASSNTLAYRVFWNDQTGTTGNVELTAGAVLSGQTGARTDNETCHGGTQLTANFQIIINQATLIATPPGSYSGTLTLIMEGQ